MRNRSLFLIAALALVGSLIPLGVGASAELKISEEDEWFISEGAEYVTRLVHDNPETGETDVPWQGSTEIDFDGERYAFIGQFNGRDDRGQAPDQGGMFIVDMVGDESADPDPDTGLYPGQFEVVSQLYCPGTDNYVRYMDPDVYSYTDGGGEFVVMAHHGNQCSGFRASEFDSSDEHNLANDPNTTSGYGAFNGITVIDVSDKTNPFIVDTIGHVSAHTVMPHPTEPYLYILPGGLPVNGTNTGKRTIAPTAIIDASDPTNLEFVGMITHNASGCHDFGFNSDGSVGFCAGLQEVSTWDLSDPANPLVIGRVYNPAIQFAHNVVVSDDDKYMVINDEAFGFHTCNNDDAVDLYGSMWIYDITVPHVPVLAGRVAPPGHPSNDVNIAGWTLDWCAAHNYNFVPGTHILVSSWFAGGMTAHDISDPMNPEMLALYQPKEGVMWSGHYYGGYLISGDMLRGSEIIDVPALREAEAAQLAEAESWLSNGMLTSNLAGNQGTIRKDRTAELIPSVLPPRPVRPRGNDGGGFCVIPGRPTL